MTGYIVYPIAYRPFQRILFPDDRTVRLKTDTTIASETKADQICRRIKSAILKGEAAPGEKLVVHRLARNFNTSIIPVREALSRLEAQDLVTIVPHTGIYVKGINLERLKELYPIRGILEGFATRLAAGRLGADDYPRLWDLIGRMDEAVAEGNAVLMGELNWQFHMEIYSACGNQSLIDRIDDLWQKTILARLIFKLTPQRARASNQEHRKIVACLENGNIRQAEGLVVRQSQKTLALLIRQFEAPAEPGTAAVWEPARTTDRHTGTR